MYSLALHSFYNKPLLLNSKYRYDFVCFTQDNELDIELLNGVVFVFRTYLDGEEAKGNVLIDLINYTNVNAFQIAFHGNSYIHFVNIYDLIEQKPFFVTDNITIEAIENKFKNIEIYVLIKNQRYEKQSKSNQKDRIYAPFTEVKYLLFSYYQDDIVNMLPYQLAPIFKLQAENIEHNKCLRYLQKNERAEWKKKSQKLFYEIMTLKSSHKYIPIQDS